MTFSDLASLGSFVSGIAVPITLAYLALQVHQSSKHARAIVHQERVNRVVDLCWRYADVTDQSDDAIRLGGAGSKEINRDALWRYLLMVRSTFHNWEDTFIQYQQGLVRGDAFEDSERTMRQVLKGIGYRAGWEVLRAFFGSHFQKYVDDLITQVEREPPQDQEADWIAALDVIQERVGARMGQVVEGSPPLRATTG